MDSIQQRRLTHWRSVPWNTFWRGSLMLLEWLIGVFLCGGCFVCLCDCFICFGVVLGVERRVWGIEALSTVEASKACVESWENMISVLLDRFLWRYSILTKDLDYMSLSADSSAIRLWMSRHGTRKTWLRRGSNLGVYCIVTPTTTHPCSLKPPRSWTPRSVVRWYDGDRASVHERHAASLKS